MNHCNALILACGLVFACLLASPSSTTASAVPVIYCQPHVLADASPEVRQMCIALMEVEAPQEGDLSPSRQIYERGTKRQDVDHVFLRFGRRL